MHTVNGRPLIDSVVGNWELPLAEFVDRFVGDDPTGHDIHHSLRVKCLVLRIAEAEGLDRDVLVATAYLHDVGRFREYSEGVDHVEVGMQLAREVLPTTCFPAGKVAAVVRCIEFHEEYEWARSGRDLVGDVSREILGFQDADRLDAMGAVGIARMFSFGGAYRRPLWVPEVEPGKWRHPDLGASTYNHLYEKLLKLRGAMNTPTGRRLAEARHQFMERFAEEFEREWHGLV